MQKRQLQVMLGNPSQEQYEELAHEKVITNFPVTQTDVTTAYNVLALIMQD